MADICFNITCKELNIVQIAQLYQLFRLLHLIHIYSQGFYELSRMLLRKNVNNDVSKDSPIFDFNSPVPSCSKPLNENEARCTNYLNENEFHLRGMKRHFLKKGLALGYALK